MSGMTRRRTSGSVPPVDGPGILDGSLQPLGWSVGFIEAPMLVVRDALLAWRRSIGREHVAVDLQDSLPSCARTLLPLQTPWTRELVVAHGDRWTCYLNNSLNGGDPAPPVWFLSQSMRIHGVVATCKPRLPVGHAQTKLEYYGPEGQPPLNYVRAIVAHAQDGRWSWHVTGTPLAFEDTSRYTARRIRDRFDRPTLVTYLGALGIDVDDAAAYGAATLVEHVVDWPSRTMTLDEARAHYWKERPTRNAPARRDETSG